MRMVRIIAVTAVGLLLVAGSVRAHHAFAAAYDESRPFDLEGTVTKVELINPHSWIWIDVEDEDGTVVNWGIEGGPPNSLFRNGVTKANLPVGTTIKVFGYQAKSGASRGVGAFLTFPDGRKVLMGGSAPGATAPGRP